MISRLRTDHKDDSLLAEGHCRPLDRAESKWQTVTRLLGLHTDCELFLLWWRAHSAAKQSWSIHANFNNRPIPLPPLHAFSVSFPFPSTLAPAALYSPSLYWFRRAVYRVLHCSERNSFLYGTSLECFPDYTCGRSVNSLTSLLSQKKAPRTIASEARIRVNARETMSEMIKRQQVF